MTFDCAVVGAGFAGLAAADVLATRGRRVCVLEARDRVGGRVCTVTLSDGTPVDIGGQWFGPTQERMYALCRRYKVATYPSYVDGNNLLLVGGKRRRHKGHIPTRAGAWTLANLAKALLQLDRLAKEVPLDAPWQAKRAEWLDQRTLGDWLRSNVSDRHAATMIQIGIESVFAADPDAISLLHAAFYMRSGNSFDFLTRSAGGAQQDRVSGGVQQLAQRLAHDVATNGEVLLETPVAAMAQDETGVTLHTHAGEVRAKRVIVAVPPPLAAAIDYTPDLSSERRALLARLPMGSVIKCVAAYRRAFWRDDGWSGATVSDEPPIHVTFDASPANGTPGMLLAFIEGEQARRLGRYTVAERRRIVLNALVRSFGGEARYPVEYVDRAWSNEAYSGGCYAAVFPPGVWTTVGHTLRRPEGRIHWAGSETATRWNGYIEGAVRSGERAAEEVLARDV